ncbi:MAG: hypothetical protein HUU11_09860 [Anaerolineales bacterium]|nr:hypothetical protein [Anaerolineales bacterium]
MTLNTFLKIAAVAYFSFGAGLLLAPVPFMCVFGVGLDPGGTMLSRILGAALIGFAMVFWRMQGDLQNSTVRELLLASFVYNLIDLPVVFEATLSGTMGVMGWSAVLLHLLLAVGFGYFRFGRK